MNRALMVGCLCVALLGPVLARAQTPALPVFDFQGADTEHPADVGKVKGCGAEADGILQCEDKDAPVVAGARTKSVLEKFNNKRLYYVLGAYDAPAYPALLAGFTQKYGPPVKTVTLKGSGGADHTVTIWEFKGGNLHLDSVGQAAGSGAFEFQDDTDLPFSQQQRIDF